MHCDFTISNGVYLVQPPYDLDLHNNFDFIGLNYSIENRMLMLNWRRSEGNWIASTTPASVTIEFQEVSEFRYYPRDAALPLTEDDCIESIGYFTDEEWADGVMVLGPGQQPDPHWLTAVSFMSGALLAVQAASGHARIKA